MRSFPIPFVATLLAALASSMPAQAPCPMQTTLHVPENLSLGPAQDCGRVDVSVIDVGGQFDGGKCPTFVVYTPPHDIAVTSTTQTYVEPLQTLPITLVTFECTTRWLLFLPIGSNCKPNKPSNVGYVQSLLARPCQPPQG